MLQLLVRIKDWKLFSITTADPPGLSVCWFETSGRYSLNDDPSWCQQMTPSQMFLAHL